MKAVFVLALAAAVSASPAGWKDAPVEPAPVEEPSSTWVDVEVPEETPVSPEEPSSTWVDAEVPAETTTWVDADVPEPTASETWEDAEISSTVVEPSATATWIDAEVPVHETTSTVTAITTVCPYPTTVVDKTDTYVVTEKTTLTLTKGPYTVVVPVYEETSTVCDEAPESTWVDAEVPAEETKPVKPYPTAPAGEEAKPAPTGYAKPEAPVSPEEVADYTGSASKMAGSGLVGLAAIAAFFL